ncbi:MAG TPA: hypothetical protein VHF07_06245 [Nitrospiraceae bacterium]|nr:hypothetical protein [Nitrospiraceae bacterium]
MPKAKSSAAPLASFTCPDCIGVLSVEREKNGHRDYRCQVGHRFSTRSLLFAKEKEVERILWAAVALLEHVMRVYARMEQELTRSSGTDRRRLKQRMKEAKTQNHMLVSMIENTHACD